MEFLNIEPTIAISASILFGLGEGAFTVIWITVLQELVPSDKLGTGSWRGE